MKTPVTLDEILFEHRNKDYGAYELRKTYNSTINRAMWISIITFSALFITPYIFAHQQEKTEKRTEVILNLQDIQKEDVPPVEAVKVEKFIEPTIVTTTEIEEALPTQTELGVAAIGNFDKDGIDNNRIIADIQATRLLRCTWIYEDRFVFVCDGDPIDSIIGVPPAVETNIMETGEENIDFLSIAEVNPSFAGGVSEMYKFFDKTLKYPTAAQGANVQGRVFVGFIIEKDGSITDVHVIKGIGFGCDEEATRAVKLMPKWVAGKQNGKNVRVRFTLPVTFKSDQ